MNTLKKVLLVLALLAISSSAIQAQYDYKHSYRNGLALVRKNSKYGYVDRNGKEVVGPMYTKATFFSEGLAAVLNFNDKWGFINTKGDWIIPATYADAKCFYGELAAVKNDKGLWGFIDKKGKLVIDHKYSDLGAYGGKDNNYIGFWDDYLPAAKDGKWGLINKKDQAILPFDYSYVRSPEDNGTVVIGKEMGLGLTLEGLADTKGKIILQPNYKSVGQPSEDMITIQDPSTQLWGYADINGNEVIKPKYKLAYNFSEGCALVSTSHPRVGEMFIDKAGNIILKSAYQLYGPFKNGLAMIMDKNMYGFINKKGALQIPAKYYDAKHFDDGIAIVMNQSYWGAINTNDKPVIDFVYWKMSRFSEGLSAVQAGNALWGYVNKKGKVEIKPTFKKAESFYKGKAYVTQNGFDFIINKDGEEIKDYY